MTIRILPESSANQNLYGAKKGDYLILAEISYTGGEYTDTYYVDKSGLLWVMGNWNHNHPYRFHLEELAAIPQIGYSRLAMIAHAIHVFLNKFDLERSWQSQKEKEHNQPDTPETSQDQIIASLVAQVNGLATSMSNMQGEMQAHKTTHAKEKEEIVSTFAELRKEVYRVEQDCFDLDKKIIKLDDNVRDEWADHHADIHVSNAGRLNVPKLWSDLYQKVDDHIDLDKEQDKEINLRLNNHNQIHVDDRNLLDDLDSRITGHIELDNIGNMSIADRLNEIEVKLHEYLPSKVLDWAHVNEDQHTAIIAQLRQEMRDFVLEEGDKIASLEKKVERLQNLTQFMANEITALELHTKLPLVRTHRRKSR